MNIFDLPRRLFVKKALQLPILVSLGAGGLVHGATTKAAGLNKHQLKTLERVSYLLFPIPDLGSGPYSRAVATLDQQLADAAQLRTLMSKGIETLDDLANGVWLELGQSRQVELLTGIEGTAFFNSILQHVQTQIFTDPEVWKLIGYEGSSLEFGGYRNRGMNDIDWLD